MADWLTAAEIAALKLPGLPHSKRKVNDFAGRNGWHSARTDAGEALVRQRAGRGGGYEFHSSLLPAVARTRIEANAGKTRTAEINNRDIDLLGPRDLSRRDARLFVLQRAEDFQRAHADLSRRQADEGYAALYTSGTGEVPDWVRPMVKTLSRPTLERWRAARIAGRFDLVAGRHSLRDGCREIERLKGGEIAAFIGGLIVKSPFFSASQIRAMVDGRYGEEIGALPSERTFQRFICSWKDKNSLALLKLTNPDKFKSHARLTGSNSNAHVRALNQLWEIDASPADVLTTDGRQSIYLVIDIWSRRVMIHVTKTPRTEATLTLIRRAILKWGVPETIRTDNGSDFTSQRFVSAMNSIGIAHETSDAFSPEQKGTVERAIGTMQRRLMAVLDGFIGHSVADRKVIEERKAFAARLGETDESMYQVNMSAADLQAHCTEWADGDYAAHAHRGLGGLTPFAKAASWAGPVKRIENNAIRALDLLLMPLGWRTATKQGIQMDNGLFIAPELMPGTRYLCRQDADDMGRLHVFTSEAGSYVTTAVCPERAGIDPREAVRAARELQAEIIADGTRAARSAARAIKPGQPATWMHEAARRKMSKVAAFPHRSTRHGSDALDAAGAATEADDFMEVPAAAIAPAKTNVVQLDMSPRQRFDKARALEQAIAAGRPVDPKEALWLGKYQTKPEYLSFIDQSAAASAAAPKS